MRCDHHYGPLSRVHSVRHDNHWSAMCGETEEMGLSLQSSKSNFRQVWHPHYSQQHTLKPLKCDRNYSKLCSMKSVRCDWPSCPKHPGVSSWQPWPVASSLPSSLDAHLQSGEKKNTLFVIPVKPDMPAAHTALKNTKQEITDATVESPPRDQPSWTTTTTNLPQDWNN